MSEREESFIETALNEMYEKAEREDAIPWNDAEVVTVDEMYQRAELEETFPGEP